jgi:hypothetical protein
MMLNLPWGGAYGLRRDMDSRPARPSHAQREFWLNRAAMHISATCLAASCLWASFCATLPVDRSR